MRILLNLTGEVLKDNLDGFKKVIKLYEAQDHQGLALVPVTKDYSGAIKSYFIDDEWIMLAYVDRKITNKFKLFFTEISSDKLVNEFKLICFAWMYTPAAQRRTTTLKPTSLIALHSKLTQVYKFLDKMGWDSITVLTQPVPFYEFCNFIEGLKYSFSNAEHIFAALRRVELSYEYIPIQLVLPTDQSTKQLATKYCCPTKNKADQFYAIPTRLMEKIYAKTIDYVEEFYPHRELLCELMIELRHNYELGKQYVDKKIDSGSWRWMNRETPDYRIEVNKYQPQRYETIIESFLIGTPLEKYIVSHVGKFSAWLTKIQTACYIVCAAFTGMRRSELYSLHADSFIQREFNGKTIYSLRSYQHKMTQGRGQLTEWVTSPLTKKAIKLAEALSRDMRSQLLCSNNPMKHQEASCLWLTQSRKQQLPNVRFEGNLRSHFNSIALEAEAIVDEQALEEFKLINPNCNPLNADKRIIVGEVWPLTTHQFRRTFAVFVRRHNLCSVVAVKDQFKHLDVPTTDWYGEGSSAAHLKGIDSDHELKNLILNVTNEVTTDAFYRWYNSSEALYGKRGLEILKERTSIPKDLKSWDEINEHVKAGRLNLVGTLHSYCLAGYDCRMDKVTSPANCFKCENQLIDEEKAQNWINRHKWVSDQVLYLDSVGSLTSSKFSHYITQIRAAERVMHFFKISHDKFDSKGISNE
jgi:integrase